jgi:hypothetical protein
MLPEMGTIKLLVLNGLKGERASKKAGSGNAQGGCSGSRYDIDFLYSQSIPLYLSN